MSVIIRLQNLPWSANALDIRQFFRGLSIPEGGVHIVGGELGDAFIAFSTDEDARQAFNLNGGKIKEVQIKLMLSSRTEMQKVIEAARNPLAAFMQRAAPVLPAIIPAAVPAIIPEVVRRTDNEKRERRRSRSRDRRDRSHERDSRERDRRDRRRRGRSRSRSRDRRDRRRRDRSRSKDRRSKETDPHSKERKQFEEENSASPTLSVTAGFPNLPKEVSKNPVWANNMPVVQTPTIMKSITPAHLQQSSLLMNFRNGLQSQTDSLGVNPWNLGILSNSMNTSGNLKAKNNVRPGNKDNFENDLRSNFNRPGRVSRFDTAFDRNHISLKPPSTRHPHPLDRLDGNDQGDYMERSELDHQRTERYERERPVVKDCCIQLQLFYGGYGEIRKFFNGLFIHNNGIKFVNDEFGKRTGIVYIRFASPSGKERALERNGMMLRDFCVELTEIKDELFETAVDRYHPPYSNDVRVEHKDESNSPIEVALDYSCLAIDDLPLFTKEQDMLKIFSEYSLQQIILENKHRHVIAYVKFRCPEDAKKAATEKAKYIYDSRTLKIRFCSDDEYHIASQEQNEVVELIDDDDDESEVSSPIETDCVSLSGLPKKTTDRDVSDFFSDVAIVPNKIHLISSNFGFIGQAYCEFPTKDDAKTAIQKNGLPLGSGIVKVKPILRSEMETSIGLAIPRDPSIKPLISNPAVRPHVPRIFGNGRKKFEQEPINYEQDRNFDSHHRDFEAGPRNFEPEHRSFNPLHRNFDPERRSFEPGRRNFEPEHRNFEPDRRNFEPDNRSFEPDNRSFEPDRRTFEPDRRTFDSNHRTFEPDCRSLESGPRSYEAELRNYEALSKDRNYSPVDDPRNFDPADDSIVYDPADDPTEFDLPPINKGLPRLMGIGRPPLHLPLPPSVNHTDMASPGCTLLMENVPYKAGLDEILGFFGTFNVLSDNVLRRYNDNGTPSGEAKVIFNTKEEAYQALEECNLGKLRDRTVYLSQC